MAEKETPKQEASTTAPRAEVKILAPQSIYVQNSAQGKFEVRIPTSEVSKPDAASQKKED